MKVLVLAQDYPNNNGGKKLMYVHVRNKYYMQNGIDVTVLNFSANGEYVYEGIRVISEKCYINEDNQYDALICHAANLKNHYRFLNKFGEEFPAFVFFFHGHEVLKKSVEYPKAYSFVKESFFRIMLRDCYDEIKFFVWRRYFNEVKKKARFVFVSNWLKKRFFENLKLDEKEFGNNAVVINNSVGDVFEKENYKPKVPLKYDFITIRSNLDSSTYCLDLLNQIARRNMQYKFLVIGKGDYFQYDSKSENIDWIDATCSHGELVNYINQARCGLMLTRNDTQGVMSCEMATFGIPLITSDIEICREIFSVYPNVRFIDNKNVEINLKEVLSEVEKEKGKKKVYLASETLAKELSLINSINNG